MSCFRAFLRARLDETEAWAEGLVPEGEFAGDLPPAPAFAVHVLQCVKAHRAIVDLHLQRDDSIWCAVCDPDGDEEAWYPCRTVRNLAAVYDYPPDWRQEWKP